MKPRILIMDDDETLRKMYKLMLDRLGCDSEITVTGEEALAKYAEARQSGSTFSVVILDLTVLDGMGGEETMQELRKAFPDVYTVVASGSARDTLQAEKGFNDALPKPFRLQELAACLRKAGVPTGL